MIEIEGMRSCKTLLTKIMKENDDMKYLKEYKVMEIFDSIQGEGAMIGMPVTFIRLAGCDMGCPWCDTKESWDATDSNIMGVDEILDHCNHSIIVITGGEPLIQDIEPLIAALHDEKKFVCIETNGAKEIPDEIDWVVCSPKPPKYEIVSPEKINEYKYVVDDNFSIDVISDTEKEIEGRIWLQTCDYGKKDNEAIAKTKESSERAYELVMKHPYLRLGVQLHKIFDFK